MRKIKIRFYILHYAPIYSGAGSSLEKLVNAIDKKKFDIEILTTNAKGLPKIENTDGITIIRVGGGPFSNNGMLTKLGKLRFSLSSFLYNFLNFRFDVIFFIGVGNVSFLSLLLSKLFKKKIITKATGVGSDDPKTIGKSLAGKISIKLMEKNSAHWIISKELYELTVNHTNWPCENLLLVTNPVNVDYKNYSSLMVERYREPRRKIKFLYVGLMSKNKGLDILLNIWVEKKPNAQLILCGPLAINEPELTNKLIDLAKSNDSIVYEGRIEANQIRDYYLECDCFLFPSLREGLPNVILEAISYSLPVISNLLPGITDYILGSRNERGIVIKNNDINLFEKFIDDFINDSIFESEMKLKSELAYNWLLENSESSIVSSKIENLVLKLYRK